MERSDDHPRGQERLATVSYLFGAPAPAPVDDSVVDEEQAEGAADGVPTAGAGSSERASSERGPRLAAVPAHAEPATAVSSDPAPSESARPAFRDPGSGWYVDPDDEAAAVEEDAPSRERGSVPTQPPAGAVAAARAFLSSVEKSSTEKSSAEKSSAQKTAAPAPTGVRFIEEDDDTASESGRRKPPPVRQASLNALARKGMSSAEMTSLLEAREVDPDEVVAEVERLEEVGLLDDRVLAEHLVRTLQDRKGLGRSAINAELRRRKVDQAAIDEVLETVDVDEELQRCLEVATKRASQLRSYDRATAERRLSAFLMRRGYAGSVISAAVAQALGPVGPRFR